MKQVKKAIAKLALKGDNAYSVKDLAMRIYEIDLEDIERRHNIPIVRAMKQLVEKHPQLVIYRGDSSGSPMIILDATSPMAQAVQRAKHASYWYNRVKPPGWKASDYWRTEGHDEAGIFQSIKKKDIRKGGSCYRAAMRRKAEIDGDEDAIAQFDKERAQFDKERVQLDKKSAEELAELAGKVNATEKGHTNDDAARAMTLLYEYSLTMDNDEDLTYDHDGKRLVFKVEDIPA